MDQPPGCQASGKTEPIEACYLAVRSESNVGFSTNIATETPSLVSSNGFRLSGR